MYVGVQGFVEFQRKSQPYRDARERVRDYKEINAENLVNERKLQIQASRCMDCGTPFCQTYTGCPVNNLIPEWNDLVVNGQWREAIDRLHATNNFPEFTGRVCPAPCEGRFFSLTIVASIDTRKICLLSTDFVANLSVVTRYVCSDYVDG